MAQKREWPLKGPWPAWAIVGLILGAYGLQSATLDIETAAQLYGMRPAELAAGRWTPLFTDLFIHGGWAHAGMNAAGALAFGAAVSRYLGVGVKGAAGFFLLYILCGVLSNLGYALAHWDGMMPLAGASGAVSGLFGAASRLIAHRPGLSPLGSRTVIVSGVAFAAANVALGLLHFAPGMGPDTSIAWEAHLSGYAAGLILIGPISALFRQPPPPEAVPEVQPSSPAGPWG